jgi:hypothetical protein
VILDEEILLEGHASLLESADHGLDIGSWFRRPSPPGRTDRRGAAESPDSRAASEAETFLSLKQYLRRSNNFPTMGEKVTYNPILPS